MACTAPGCDPRWGMRPFGCLALTVGLHRRARSCRFLPAAFLAAPWTVSSSLRTARSSASSKACQRPLSRSKEDAGESSASRCPDVRHVYEARRRHICFPRVGADLRALGLHRAHVRRAICAQFEEQQHYSDAVLEALMIAYELGDAWLRSYGAARIEPSLSELLAGGIVGEAPGVAPRQRPGCSSGSLERWAQR